jgi:methionine-rich copper-binding protein CopC
MTISAPALAAAPRTGPALNAALSAAPRHISIPVDGAAHGATITVLDADRRPAAARRATVADGHLAAALPRTLKRGVYTVIWRAPGAIPGHGTFAFAITGAAAPTLVDDAAPEAQLNPLWRGLPRFFAFALEMTMIGVPALRFLVTSPGLRRYGRIGGALAGPVDRRLLQSRRSPGRCSFRRTCRSSSSSAPIPTPASGSGR